MCRPRLLVVSGDHYVRAHTACTYRLQFNARFTLEQATALIDYLHDLGISDCYASPLTLARPGSNHGYDVTNHSVINPEVGSEEQLVEFARRLNDAGDGPDSRHCAQSHVHLASVQSLVVGRAGERAEFALCALLRYRLESTQGRPHQQGAAPDARRSIWKSAGERRDKDRL